MIISTLKRKVLRLGFVLGFLALLYPADAQFYVFLEGVKNASISYDFQSGGGNAIVDPADPPAFGNASVQCVNTDCNLIYSPNTDYVGRDTLTLVIYGKFGGVSRRMLEIDVLPGYVSVQKDYATTTIGQSVTSAILNNDSGSGPLAFSHIGISNNGTASYDSTTQSIQFIPDPGFTGEAYIHYTACVDSVTCDEGYLTVFVQDPAFNSDTIALATKREVSKDLLVYTVDGYNILAGPSHGSVSLTSDGTLTYTPNSGAYNLLDTFSVAYNTNTSNTSFATFIIDLLDTAPPSSSVGIAKDDVVHVAVDGGVYATVLNNDAQILGLEVRSIVTPPANAAFFEITSNDQEIYYEPNPGFSGVDRLVYKACKTDPNVTVCENAELLIVVDNLEPAATLFEIETIKNTPYIIEYNPAFADYYFNNVPSTSINGGTLEYHAYFNGALHGQQVEGENLIFYYPPSDYVGTDRFEFDYCPGINPCELVKIDIDVQDMGTAQDTFCVSNCVFPGDANHDGQVDIQDLLPIGFCLGEVGSARPNGSTTWYGQYGSDWEGDMAQGINFKHIDTDGNGVVEAADTAAITSSFGRIHNIVATSGLPNQNLPLFFVETSTPPYAIGDLLSIDVVLGAAASPAIDVNGLTFSTPYDDNILALDFAAFSSDSWLAYNAPVLDLIHEPYTGLVEAGVTRANELSASGYGTIGTLNFIVIDEVFDGSLPQKFSLPLTFTNITAMNGSGIASRLPDQTIEVEIDRGLERKIGSDDLLVYPNPATEEIQVRVSGNNEIREYYVYNLTGQKLYDSGKIRSEMHNLDVSKWESGLYIVHAITEEGVVGKKFEIFRPE